MQKIFINEITEDTLLLIRSVVETYPEEIEFSLQIDSNGGDLDTAIKCYDYLRTTDRLFIGDIIGSCHSAAVLLLLGCTERVANPNSKALLHLPSVELEGNYNTTLLENINEEMKKAKEKIATIYADRTLLSFEEALVTLEEEKMRDASWLLDKGFIQKINLYINNKNMNIALKIMNLLNKAVEVVDTEGNVVFTVEELPLEVGKEVSVEEGEFIIPEVGKVTVKEGVITEIEVEEPKEEAENPITEEVVEEPQIDEEKEALKAELAVKEEEIAKLTEEIEALKAELEASKSKEEEQKVLLEESLDTIKELKNKVKSSYKPEQRITNTFATYKDNFYKIMK